MVEKKIIILGANNLATSLACHLAAANEVSVLTDKRLPAPLHGLAQAPFLKELRTCNLTELKFKHSCLGSIPDVIFNMIAADNNPGADPLLKPLASVPKNLLCSLPDRPRVTIVHVSRVSPAAQRAEEELVGILGGSTARAVIVRLEYGNEHGSVLKDTNVLIKQLVDACELASNPATVLSIANIAAHIV